MKYLIDNNDNLNIFLISEGFDKSQRFYHLLLSLSEFSFFFRHICPIYRVIETIRFFLKDVPNRGMNEAYN